MPKELSLKTAGIIFAVISLMHLLRFIFKIPVLIGGYAMPFWFSAFGFIVFGILAIGMLRTLE